MTSSGGTGTLVLAWDNGETGVNPMMLCTGWNTLTISDQNGCMHDDSMFISSPPALFTNVTTNDASCFGVCDGDATSNPSGGNGAPYTWLWSTTDITNSVNALCAGSYDLHIEDVNGCPKDTTIIIDEPPALVITTLNQTNLVCFNQCIGELEVAGSNGTAPYSYQWFDDATGLPTGDVDSLAENLCAGDYYVIVTDANGCSQQSGVFTVTEPPQLVISANGIVDVLCFGDCNGEAVGNAAGGTPGYTFTWVDNVTAGTVGAGNNINTLCAGDYYLEVEDLNGCIEQTPVFTINEPTDLTSTLTTVDILCNSVCTGSATITPSGGTVAGNYTIEWHSVATGLISAGTATSIGSLCAGDYFAIVIDDNLCRDSTPNFTINEPTALTINPIITNLVCNGQCDGEIDANPSGGTAPYTYTWFDCATMTPIGGATAQVIPNLCAGSYYVEVEDDNGCTVDNSGACSIVTEPTAVNISLVGATNATCLGTCDGAANVSTGGGTAPRTVTWHDDSDDSQIATGSSINTLCAGTYYAVVTDGNGCTDTTVRFTITDNVIVSGTVSINQATCNGFCDGQATATPSGGALPYTYEWIETAGGTTLLNGPASAIAGLCAGNYTLIITDANGCASAVIPFTVTDSPILIADVSVTDASCNGICDGTATANPSGGSGLLNLTWTPAPGAGQGTALATAMCAGNYNLNITDANGCAMDTLITVNEPSGFDFSFSTTNELCTGDCDGTINVTLNSGGVAPITYTYNPAPAAGQGTTNATGLCPGNYTLTIEDVNGCDTTVNFTINPAPALNVSAIVVSDVSCNGDCDGVAQATATGGTGTLNYNWTPAPGSGQGTNTAADLCAGAYTVEVTDDNGCMVTDNVTINEPTQYTITTSSTDVQCNGACNGTATVNVVSGGTGAYTYLWSDPLNQTTPTATGLCAGNYTVTVSDANNCDTILNIVIVEPTALTVSVTNTPASCFGQCDGTAAATVSGGTAGYNIEWFSVTSGLSVGNGTNIASLCADDYFAEVTDANGCVVNSANFTITQDPQINASIVTSNSNCGVCDGTATVVASGGSGTFVNYTWTPAPGAGQGTANGSSMCAGVYSVLIEDSNGCTESFNVSVNDNASETVTTDSVDVACNGACSGQAIAITPCIDGPCTYEWFDDLGVPIGQMTSTATNLCVGLYTVAVTNASGCVTTADVNIDQAPPLLPNETFSGPVCNGDGNGTATVAPTGGAGGYTYLWNPVPPGGQGTATATGLSAGVWSVTITDLTGCDTTVVFTLTDPPFLDVSNTSSTDVSCFGVTDGVATVFPTGGLGSYTYEWFRCITNANLGGTNQQVAAMPPGSYYVIVTDSLGCSQTSACIDINEPADITGVLSSTDVNCNGNCDGTAQVVASGGVGNYNYQWLDGATPIAGGTGDNISNLCPGTYSVEVTDLNGCSQTISSVVISEPGVLGGTATVNDVSCSGVCNGSATITPTGGTAPFSYNWSPAPGLGQGTATGSLMCAGNYTVTVTDLNGCTVDIPVVIGTASVMVINATITPITCNGDANGAIQTAVTGGSPGYLYSWSPNGEISSGITGLSGDTYMVTVQDANGCTVDTTINLIEPSAITATTSSNNATCGNSDGSASISPSGGLGGYTYFWSPAPGGGQGTQTATGLSAGIYTVTVTDIGGCAQDFIINVSDIGAETVTTSSTPASCFDGTDGTATANFVCADPTCNVEWFDAGTGLTIGQTTTTATGLSPGNYLVEVTNNSGCVTIEPVTVGSPSEILANETITNVSCVGNTDGQIVVAPSGGSGAGYTFLWAPAPGGGQGTNTATGLTDGIWTVLITDGSGCDSLFTFTVNAPNGLTTTIASTNVSCNGQANGSITVTPTGGTLPYNYQWLDNTLTPIGGETNSSITGITAGDYSVTVTDNSGCSVTVGPTTITEPTAITSTISGTDASCNGFCDGTATVVPSGGTGTLVVNWFESPGNTLIGQMGTTANGLCAGDYYAEITDDNGCTFTTPIQTIAEPAAFTATVSGTDANCNGVCDGTATVVVSGGVGTLTYNWLDSGGLPVTGGGVPAVTSLCPDTYTIEVIDNTGCSTGVLPITINEPTALAATVFVNSASCNVNDGSASVAPSGGTAPYDFQWFDAAMVAIAGETSADLLNQASGTYFVEVTDDLGCSDVFQADISAQTGAVIVVDSIHDASCFGEATGSAFISVSGGLGPYVYIWNPGGSIGEDLLSVEAGSYTVEVIDLNGCSTFENVVINEAPELTATFTSVDATCGSCDGEITANASGGSGPITYVWSNGGSTSTIDNLCSGAYGVRLTDSLGCNVTIDTVVNDIGGPTGETVVANDPTCNGGDNGDITVTPTGGTTPYTYRWLHDGGTTNMATNLSAGTYILEVTDSNGCVRNVSVTLGEPAAIQDNAVITPANCGICDGEITLTPTGVNPININWLHGPSTQTISALCEGIYTVELTDGNACVDTFSYQVNGRRGADLVLTATDASCETTCDGFIVADTIGGTQPITFNWLDDAGNPIGQSNDTATALCSGTYFLEVTDGNGCRTFDQIDVNHSTGIQFNTPRFTDVLCAGISDGTASVNVIGGTFPYTYNWSPAPGVGQGTSSVDSLGVGTYTVDVTDQNGCTAQESITISEPTPIVITLDSLQNALCASSTDGYVHISASGGTPNYTYDWTSSPAGFTANTQDIDAVIAQDYIVAVTDSNNCVMTDTFTVSALVAITAFAGNDFDYCSGDTVSVIGTGGGTVGLSYSWYDTSGTQVSGDSLLTVADTPGVYMYVLEVASGLCLERDTITLTVNGPPIVDAGVDDNIVEGNSVTIGGSPTGPVGSAFTWSPNFEIDDILIENPSVSPDTTTTYSVMVVDTNGCSQIDSVVISVLPDIVFPNGFSPNGDGVNDTWEIDFMDEFPESVIEVYNRWGDLLFRTVGYVDEWDGRFNNQPLPVGTYYYIINLNHPLYPDAFTGPITILR